MTAVCVIFHGVQWSSQALQKVAVWATCSTCTSMYTILKDQSGGGGPTRETDILPYPHTSPQYTPEDRTCITPLAIRGRKMTSRRCLRVSVSAGGGMDDLTFCSLNFVHPWDCAIVYLAWKFLLSTASCSGKRIPIQQWQSHLGTCFSGLIFNARLYM